MAGFFMVIGWDMVHLLHTFIRPVSKLFHPRLRLAVSTLPDGDGQGVAAIRATRTKNGNEFHAHGRKTVTTSCHGTHFDW
jgi:hypothetical protein